MPAPEDGSWPAMVRRERSGGVEMGEVEGTWRQPQR
jgi:hypothetical protein